MRFSGPMSEREAITQARHLRPVWSDNDHRIVEVIRTPKDVIEFLKTNREDKNDTMVDAIALSSPSGRMSKRARKAAERRLSVMLFGEHGLAYPSCPQPEKRTQLLRQAAELRALADRGMKVRAYRRKAEQLEGEADELRDTSSQAEREAIKAVNQES